MINLPIFASLSEVLWTIWVNQLQTKTNHNRRELNANCVCNSWDLLHTARLLYSPNLAVLELSLGMRHGLYLAGITIFWLVGLSIGWDCSNIMYVGPTWPVQISTILQRPLSRWQSPCTALTAGLPLRLCKETVKESSTQLSCFSWWRHQMEIFSALLGICAGNLPVPGEFPAQRPVMWSFDVFFYLRLTGVSI